MHKGSTGFAIALAVSVLVFSPAAGAGLFSSRYDDFRELAQAGNTESAAALYAGEPEYFARLKGEKRQYVDEVMGQRDRLQGERLNGLHNRLLQADAEPGQMLRWQKLKAALPEAKAGLATAEKLSARGTLTNAAMTELAASLTRIGAALQSEAPQALLDYGLFTQPAFKDQYPVPVRWAAFNSLPAQFDSEIGKASATRLAAFRAQFGDTLIPARKLEARLGECYVAARLRETGARSYLARRKVREQAVKEGWTVEKAGGNVLLAAWPAPKSEAGIYRASPPDAMAYRQMEVSQTPADVIAAGGLGQYDLVVFVRPHRVMMTRDESNIRQISSQYQSGTQRIPNPDYPQAQAALRAAENELASVRQTIANSSANSSTGTLGALAAMVSVASESAAENRVRSAQRALDATPPMVDQAVMSPYAYSARTTAVREWITVHYAVYDPGTGQVSTGSVERVWKKVFEVADQVHQNDPQRSSILKAAKTSREVDAWISEPVDDKYEAVWKAIFSDYNKNSWGI